MQRSIAMVLVLLAGTCAARAASAHNVLTSMYAPAGYVHDMEMRVTHGCKGSPVTQVRIKIPEGVTRVSAGYTRDWDIELKMRKLPKAVPGEGGTMITETVDEIVWKNPKSPLPASGMFEGFKFRGSLPDKPGEILFFKTINDCVKGDDKYIDMPKESLNAKTPGLSGKLWAFMTATPGPSPFLILEKPSRPQYPFAPPADAKPPAR
jgi:uncharacterized protein YcnI